MPLISVIVPCYNQAQYLDECLQSVLDQTYTDWECIIVNDGSPDNTEEIAKKWTEKDTRFKYLYKENGGVSAARNFGIKNTNGKWILPLDADDKIGNQYLELAEKEFNKYDLIYCKAEFFGTINETWNISSYDFDKMKYANQIFCSAFYKKQDWETVNGYDELLVDGYEDWDFWLSILHENSKVLRLNYTGFFYRRKDTSRDVSINNNKALFLKTYNYIYKKHLEKYLHYDPNSIKNYAYIKNQIESYHKILSKIQKNKFTKLLFKVIETL